MYVCNFANMDDSKILLRRLVYLEGLSLTQQIGTFITSDVIVSTHGAAEANLMFMSPVSV